MLDSEPPRTPQQVTPVAASTHSPFTLAARSVVWIVREPDKRLRRCGDIRRLAPEVYVELSIKG
jgi:hypothetical protein